MPKWFPTGHVRVLLRSINIWYLSQNIFRNLLVLGFRQGWEWTSYLFQDKTAKKVSRVFLYVADSLKSWFPKTMIIASFINDWISCIQPQQRRGNLMWFNCSLFCWFLSLFVWIYFCDILHLFLALERRVREEPHTYPPSHSLQAYCISPSAFRKLVSILFSS